jgi:diaminopimelate decarboxylase
MKTEEVAANEFNFGALRSIEVSELLSTESRFLIALATSMGSPLHVILPQQFERNISCMQKLLQAHEVRHRIMFAKKANKAAAFIAICSKTGIGVDAASAEEISATLSNGVTGPNIVVTGPEKSDRVLRLAILHESTVSVDSISELNRIRVASRIIGKPAHILLRLRPSSESKSRFGWENEEIAKTIQDLSPKDDSVALCGLSFHLSGYDLKERADVALEALALLRIARDRGFANARVLDIGGGLPVRYLASDLDHVTLNGEAFHGGHSFADFYPYGTTIDWREGIDAILSYRKTEDGRVGDLCRQYEIELWVEPGRALLDQCGFTLFRIQGVKRRSYSILTVEGTSFSLSEQWFNSEYLPDPVVLSERTSKQVSNGRPEEYCVGGSTCLENDMLSWLKRRSTQPLTVGDWLAYLNTAGYQMDSNESHFHELGLPQKVAVFKTSKGWSWCADSMYQDRMFE